MSFFDVANSSVKDIYSFTLGEWIAPQGDSLLLAILNHSLTPVPEGSRKRIGPPPKEGADTRALWTPPLILHGKKVLSPPCTVLECHLEERRVELFFTKDNFPFPIWTQVTDPSGARLTFRMIDSGHKLLSSKSIPVIRSPS